jgi:hypothetical protein
VAESAQHAVGRRLTRGVRHGARWAVLSRLADTLFGAVVRVRGPGRRTVQPQAGSTSQAAQRQSPHSFDRFNSTGKQHNMTLLLASSSGDTHGFLPEQIGSLIVQPVHAASVAMRVAWSPPLLPMSTGRPSSRATPGRHGCPKVARSLHPMPVSTRSWFARRRRLSIISRELAEDSGPSAQERVALAWRRPSRPRSIPRSFATSSPKGASYGERQGFLTPRYDPWFRPG